MGEVFLALDLRTNRRVAIKRLRGETLRSADGHQQRRRLLHEARTVARLDHPAIVRIHEVVESGDSDGGMESDWIVMEYVEGRTLRSLITAGPLPIPATIALGIEIAAGLAEAHSKKVIHRDLKTENVLVDIHGHVKIVDFGIAKEITGGKTLNGTQGVIGTCRAMSPEQVRGEVLDPRSDLFSFGILLYELTTGKSPFSRFNDLETMQRILEFEPPAVHTYRPDLPLELSLLITQLMQKDRNLRPRRAEEVADALREIPVAGETVEGALKVSPSPSVEELDGETTVVD